MKKTYILLLYSAVHHMPQAISGKSGKLYGHAVYDPKRNAHMLKIPADQWEPDMKDSRKIKAGKDIMENSRRRSTINVICETEVDPRDASMAMADEYDKMQARASDLETSLALLPKVKEATARLWATLRGSGQPATPETSQGEAPEQPAAPDTIAGRLDRIPFRRLRDLAKTINEERPKSLDIAKLKKMSVMVDAMAGLPFILEYLPAVECEIEKAA